MQDLNIVHIEMIKSEVLKYIQEHRSVKICCVGMTVQYERNMTYENGME